jgi:pimeloyl-ACP methyl ester carboxylesterase
MSVTSRPAEGPRPHLRRLAVPGARIAYRRAGEGPTLLLLHATLSSAGQLRRLTEHLSATFTVIAIDRRGSGATELEPAMTVGPIDVAVHVADIGAVLAAEGLGPALVVGHSYGGALALELAARRPDLVVGVWAFEPPYAPVGRPAVRAALVALERATAEAGRLGGPGAAAEAFLAGVAGPEAIARLAPASLERLRQAGNGALADAGLLGLDPDGLALIDRPVELALGGASEPFYAELAAGLVTRIAGASLVSLPGARHDAPIVDPTPVAAAIRGFADRRFAHPPWRTTR